MVDVDDIQGYSQKFENQREKLAESDKLTEADREAIGDWMVHLRTNDSSVESIGTVVGHLNRIRLCAERAEQPLTEFDRLGDVNALELRLKDEYDLAESTIRGYKKGLKKFFAWQEADFADDITIGAPIESKHDPDEEITSDELGAMLDACAEFDAAARDKAMIALLRDTGLRLGAVLSLRVGDVDISSRRATITINDEANVKDASGARPLTWSRGYVANWLDVHPRPGREDAALIHKTRRFDADEDGALRQQYAGQRISKIAEAADVDSDRIHAHLFRGTAISEWIRDGMSEQQIKHRAAWTEDSRMLATYSMVSDEEINEEIFGFYGIGDDEDRSPDLEECPMCKTPLRGTERFCPSCAAALDSAAADAEETIEDDTFESAKVAEASDGRFIDEFRRRFKNDPEFRARFLGDHHDSS
jgi:integrase